MSPPVRAGPLPGLCLHYAPHRPESTTGPRNLPARRQLVPMTGLIGVPLRPFRPPRSASTASQPGPQGAPAAEDRKRRGSTALLQGYCRRVASSWTRHIASADLSELPCRQPDRLHHRPSPPPARRLHRQRLTAGSLRLGLRDLHRAPGVHSLTPLIPAPARRAGPAPWRPGSPRHRGTPGSPSGSPGGCGCSRSPARCARTCYEDPGQTTPRPATRQRAAEPRPGPASTA